MITKIITLSVVLLFIFFIFRIIKKNSNKEKENLKDNIIDLEKDPESDEYKPKK